MFDAISEVGLPLETPLRAFGMLASRGSWLCKHLYTLIGRGEIATVTIGRRRLVTATELDRFVDDLVSSSQ